MSRRSLDQDYNDDEEIKKAHHFISLKKKQRLIQLVEKGNFSIYKAAQRLKVCHPTAKFIMKAHRTALALRNKERGTLKQPIGAPVAIQNSQGRSYTEQISPNIEPNIRQSSSGAIMQPIQEQNTLPNQFWAFYSYDYILSPVYYI